MCNNVVTLYTPKGREVPLQCGSTGFHGERVICEPCRNDPDAMREIERHERAQRMRNITANNIQHAREEAEQALRDASTMAARQVRAAKRAREEQALQQRLTLNEI